jgi:hypothetical protein
MWSTLAGGHLMKVVNLTGFTVPIFMGHTVVQLVEALCHKPEGREFNSRWCHWISHNPSGCTVTLELTQPLTEMSTRHISWGLKAAGEYG